MHKSDSTQREKKRERERERARFRFRASGHRDRIHWSDLHFNWILQDLTASFRYRLARNEYEKGRGGFTRASTHGTKERERERERERENSRFQPANNMPSNHRARRYCTWWRNKFTLISKESQSHRLQDSNRFFLASTPRRPRVPVSAGLRVSPGEPVAPPEKTRGLFARQVNFPANSRRNTQIERERERETWREGRRLSDWELMRNYDRKFDSPGCIDLSSLQFQASPRQIVIEDGNKFLSHRADAASSLRRAMEDSINFVALIELEHVVDRQSRNADAVLIYSRERAGKKGVLRSFNFR